MKVPTTLLASLGALNTALAFTPSSGCGKPLGAGIKKGGTGSSNTVTITSGGTSRSFLLHIPSNYNIGEARGLIFSFHGRGGASADQEQRTLFSDPWFNKDNFAVYPQGIDNQWQGDPAASTNDVQFTLDVLDWISNNYCVNTDAVYSTGFSNGGGFSLNTLACDAVASTRFAAFAANSGAYYQENTVTGCQPLTVPIPCQPGRQNVPILSIHGSADNTIAYNGGVRREKCLPTIPHFITAWATRDGLDTSNKTTKSFNNRVHLAQFGDNEGKLGLVTSYWVSGLNHNWASTQTNSQTSVSTFIDATSIMMNWFNKYTLK